MPLKKLPNQKMLVALAFIIVSLIWGAASPVIKYTLNYIPPFTLLFLRLLIVCIVLLPYIVIKLLGTKVNRKDYLNFFLLGVFSQSALAITFVSLKYTSALDATVIGILTGALTIYAGHYFYKEKVGFNHKLGMIFTAVGTLIVIIEPFFGGALDQIPVYERVIGNILAFIYSLTWVVYVIWSKMSMGENSKLLKKTLSFIHIKPMTKKYSPVMICVLTMYVGLLTSIPLALMENSGFFGPTNFSMISIEPNAIMGLLYLAIFSSIFAYLLNQWALENGRIADSVIYGYLAPVFAFPVAFWLLGESPTNFLLLGTAIIAVGVIIAENNSACDV